MATFNKLVIFVVFMASFSYTLPAYSNGDALSVGEIIKEIQYVEQKFTVPGYSCYISLEISSMGGFLEMKIIDSANEKKMIVKGVNSLVAVGDDKIIYTISPTYGNFPAITIYNCGNDEDRILDQGINVVPGYSSGSDYYEIIGFDDETGMVNYYYAKNINEIDFSTYVGAEKRKINYLKVNNSKVKPSKND